MTQRDSFTIKTNNPDRLQDQLPNCENMWEHGDRLTAHDINPERSRETCRDDLKSTTDWDRVVIARENDTGPGGYSIQVWENDRHGVEKLDSDFDAPHGRVGAMQRKYLD